MDYVYPVITHRVENDGEGVLIGIYKDEFTARRVAHDQRLQDDEYIVTGPWPIYDVALTIGDDKAPAEPSVSYQRNGWS